MASQIRRPIEQELAGRSDPQPKDSCVIVVDDDDLIRQLLGRQLQSHGYAFLGLERGAALLEHMASHPTGVCAILLDQSMPQLTGIEVATQLVEDGCATPIILMSGDPYPIADQARDLAVPILAKPFTFDDLLELLRGVHVSDHPNALPD